MKIIVIGSNHAGTAAIRTMLTESKENEVIVFDKNSNISFLGCGMALWIGGQISTSDGLFYSDKEELESMGATVHMQTEVTNIDFDNKTVYAKSTCGKEYEEKYDKLLLATGSIPFIPNIKGKELENVQQVKLFQDAQKVKDKCEDDSIKNVSVVGAGYIGVELAEAFRRHGKNVTLIDIAPTSLATYYDDNFTPLMNKNLEDNGIALEFSQAVTELKGDTKVTSVVTDKKEIPADLVVLCIGFKPNTALGKDKLETFRNGAYMVNKHQETSVKDVYAIGDSATVYDNSIGKENYIALATNSVRSGIVAAYNILGTPLKSVGVQGSNGISIFGLHMVSTGLTVNKAKNAGIEVEFVDFKDKQKADFMEIDNPEVQIRIVYEKDSRRILGAQMASTYDMSMGIHMFSLAIQKEVTIDELKLLDIFFLPHFNKPFNYITMAALSAK